MILASDVHAIEHNATVTPDPDAETGSATAAQNAEHSKREQEKGVVLGDWFVGIGDVDLAEIVVQIFRGDLEIVIALTHRLLHASNSAERHSLRPYLSELILAFYFGLLNFLLFHIFSDGTRGVVDSCFRHFILLLGAYKVVVGAFRAW